MKVEQVAEITGFSADWVRKMARSYNALGAEGIVDGHQKSPGGKQKALTPEQQKQLFERLQSPPDDGGLWSGPKVPQLNPTECIWPMLRERLANKVFDNLDALEAVLIERCQWLMNNPITVKGEVGFSWLCSI